MRHLLINKQIGYNDINVLVNIPIVTIEITQKGQLISYGISYCRPTDTWDIITGIRHALKSALDKIDFPIDREEIWNIFVEEFKKIQMKQDIEYRIKAIRVRIKLDKLIEKCESHAKRN